MTHAYLGLAAFDVLLAVAGLAVIDGLGLAALAGRARSLGLAFFVGWTATAAVLSLAACWGIYPGAGGTIAVIAIIAATGLGFRSLPLQRSVVPAPVSMSKLAPVAAATGWVLVVVALGSALVDAVQSTADTFWDVWAFWLPKANAIYYFHGLSTGLGGFTTFANPQYPPLFPVMTAATYHVTGSVHPSLLPLQMCVVGISFVAAVAVVLRPFVKSWVLAPALAMLSLAPEFSGRLISVAPDQTVGYLLAFAALTSALWFVDGSGAWLGVATLSAGAATLTKSEGLMLSLLLAVLVAIGAMVARRAAGAPALVLFLGPAAGLVWRHWLTAHHQPTTAGDYRWSNLFDTHFLAGRGHRLAYATGQLSHLVFDRSIWLFVMPLAIAACVLALRMAPTVALVTLVWLGVSFTGLLATYWIGFPEIHWYIETSAPRVIATLPLVAGTVLPLMLGLALGQVRGPRH